MFQVSKLSVKMSFLDNGVMSLTFFQGFLHWPIFISLYLSIFCILYDFSEGSFEPSFVLKGAQVQGFQDKHFCSPSRVKSVKVTQSEYRRALLSALGSSRGSTFFSYNWLNRLGG